MTKLIPDQETYNSFSFRREELLQEMAEKGQRSSHDINSTFWNVSNFQICEILGLSKGRRIA